MAFFNKKTSYFLLLACIVLLGACRKRMIMPFVPAGERVVLLEEFTGKGCTNCPNGSREIENLQSIYDEQLVVVSIHANFFADPAQFPLGQYDLRTDEGEKLFDLLGPNFGYPAGVIDRRYFNNELQQPASVWSGFVAQESALDPEVDFTLTKIYDPLSRRFDLFVDGRARAAVSTPLRISVMLTEDGIIDAQDDNQADPHIVLDYEHNHVLRDMFTPFDGQALAPGLAEGEEFNETFSYTIPQEFDANHCHVIVFVHRASSDDLYVLQAGEIAVTE